AARYLQLQPLSIAAADIGDDLGDFFLIDAKLFERRAAEDQGGFERLADLVVDAHIHEPDCRAAVKGARQYRNEREFFLHVLGYAHGGFRLVDTDEHRTGAACTSGMQNIEPRAVAVVDLEAEIGGGLDHFDVIVDDRDVDAAQQQGLADDLAEPAEADDEHAAVQPIRDLDAFQTLLVLRRQRAQD